MRWTRLLRQTNATSAEGEGVWFWRPDAGAKLRRMTSYEVTVAKEPGHREEREGNRNTIAQGKPELLRLTCGPTLCFLLHGAHGCNRHPAFPAPSEIEGVKRNAKLGRNVPRERGLISLIKLHRHAPRRRGIQY